MNKIHADAFGGMALTLPGGYPLALFQNGIRGEDWRIFRPKRDDPHFVAHGGRIRSRE